MIIVRWPEGEGFCKGRSYCRSCKNRIAWYDNIPLLSFLLLKGKCRSCSEKISWQYPIVELVMAVLFSALYLKMGLSWTLLELLIFGFGLVTISVIDLKHYLIPDLFSLSGIVIGLVGAVLSPEREWISALFGVLLGGGFLWAIAVIYFALTKKEGMGGGDIKLLAWIGAVLGWQAVPFVILASSLIGTLVGLEIGRAHV